MQDKDGKPLIPLPPVSTCILSPTLCMDNDFAGHQVEMTLVPVELSPEARVCPIC